MTSFSECKEPVSISQINAIEQELSLKFPDQYINHLLAYNGGICTPDVFAFNENGKITHSSLNRFLAIHDGKYSNLRSYIDIYKTVQKRLPKHVVPIANDPGGNLICVSCGDKDYGHIYFWDHENEVDYSRSNDSNYSNLYLIANSFDQFIDSLMKYS